MASDSRPTAIFLIHDLAIGGAERAFVQYVNGLSGLRPVAGLVRWGGALAPTLTPGTHLFDLSDPRAAGYLPTAPRHGGAPPTPALAPVTLLRKAWRLSRVVRRTRARVASTFLHKSHLIAATARAAFCPRLRLVFNVHELPSQHLHYHFGPAGRAALRLFTRYVFPRADRIIAVAEAVKRDLVDNFRVPPQRITVVHNPVDAAALRRAAAEPPMPEDAETLAGIDVIAIGRLVPLKGFDVLVDAIARVATHLKVHALLVGDGGERDGLERRIAARGLADRVHILGARLNPWTYLARARVLALTSRTEAFPSVLSEAMALGVPVVAAESSAGVSELLAGGRCGLLVPPDDPGVLARALERLLSDATLRDRLVTEGRERVRAFDPTAILSRYEDVIRGVLTA